jgi:alkylation response protein AidB-like acyl-CoA dehydrogenase
VDTENDFELVRGQAAAALATVPASVALRGLLEQRGRFDGRIWQLARESGWFGVGVAESDGGLGMGLAERCALAEELGRHLASAPITITSCVIAAVARFGSDEQRTRWLPEALHAGSIGTLACFESADGGIPTEPAVAWRDGRLYGSKVAVCGGLFASSALVPSRDEHGHRVVVLADLRAAGVEKIALDTLDNSRGYGNLIFDGLRAEPLAGTRVLDSALAELALMTAFEQIGGAQRCLDQARDFALERRAFGQPIGAFQSIKHGLADLYVLIQLARGAAFAAVRAAGTADSFSSAAAARLAATRAYDQAAQESIQIHGGQGCAFEADHHLHYRRARCLALEWGGPPVWRERLLSEALQGHAS